MMANVLKVSASKRRCGTRRFGRRDFARLIRPLSPRLGLSFEPLEERLPLAFEVVDSLILTPGTETVDIIARGSDWAYFDEGIEPGATWNQPSDQFDDADWFRGPAPLGYGDEGEATMIRCAPAALPCDDDTITPTHYFRHSFEVTDPSDFSNLVLMVARADQALGVYLNGTAIHRDNGITEDTTAEDFGLPTTIRRFTSHFRMSPALLLAGTNTFAVEYHRSANSNRPVFFDLELRGTVLVDELWRLELDFNEPIDAATIQTRDVTLNGHPVEGWSAAEDDSIQFDIPSQALSNNLLIDVAGDAIVAKSGEPVEAHQETVSLNVTPQYVIRQQPRLQLGDAPLSGFPGSQTDQMEVLWQTVMGGDGQSDHFVVEYREVGSREWAQAELNDPVITEVANRIVWSAEIDGLEYASEYEYRLRHIRESVVIGVYRNQFQTRLPVGSDEPFSFAAYGDSAFTSGTVGFRNMHRHLNQSDVAFSLLLGDVAYSRVSHQDLDSRFDARLGHEVARWNAQHVDYIGFGNHEMLTDLGQPARDSFSVPIPRAGVTAPAEPPAGEFPEHNYSFDYGNVHFVTFDTNVAHAPDRLDGLLTWVEHDLAASQAKWKIVFGHQPVAFGPEKPESPADDYYQQVVTRLNQAGVDLFLVGHSHTYSWTKPLLGQVDGVATFVDDNDKQYNKGAGLIQVTSGVGGVRLRPGLIDDPAVAAFYSLETEPRSRTGYAQLDVESDRLVVRYIDERDGSVMDAFEIVTPTGPAVTMQALAADVTLAAVDRVFLEFSQPVDNVTADDVRVLRDGIPVEIPSSASVSTFDNQLWQLTGLNSASEQPGIYSIMVGGDSDIVNSLGEPLVDSIPDTWVNARQAGDANADGVFNQTDVVMVLAAGKYRTGEMASWDEGDWNGDGKVDPFDLIAALRTSNYLKEPYFP